VAADTGAEIDERTAWITGIVSDELAHAAPDAGRDGGAEVRIVPARSTGDRAALVDADAPGAPGPACHLPSLKVVTYDDAPLAAAFPAHDPQDGRSSGTGR